jgi:erythromycin esterase
MIRRIVLLVLLVITISADAQRRRAVRFFPSTPIDESTPGGWLTAHAFVLSGAQLTPDSRDLTPLRSMVGTSPIVALGDATHGTSEFYTMKLRVVDFLVREMDFDVVAFEGPFHTFERLDHIVQGGPGDPRAILNELTAISYFFWDAEEIAQLVEWMREYNAHRGDRPAVHLTGFDVTQPAPAAAAVVSYLRTVDPAYAAEVEEMYECARQATINITTICQQNALRVRNGLEARETVLASPSPDAANAYEEAMQNARLVVQSRWAFGENRDINMAANTLWLRQHRGVNRKVILWGHSAHLTQAAHEWIGPNPMGKLLADQIGDDYYAITTMTAAGSFLQWEDAGGRWRQKTTTFAPLTPNSYETYIRQRGSPYLLIPFGGTLPEWLTTPKVYNAAGATGEPNTTGSLPVQFDAAIFIDTTTPMKPIP